MKGLIIATGIIGLLVGSGFGSWFGGWRGERYQALRLGDMIVARLDTKTGEMKVFVPVEAASTGITDRLHLVGVGHSFEWRVSPSEVKLVTDMGAVERCDYLGYLGSNEDTEAAAKRGGDTIFRGKNQGGGESVWVYRCKVH